MTDKLTVEQRHRKRILEAHSSELTADDLRWWLKQSISIPDHIKGALLTSLTPPVADTPDTLGLLREAREDVRRIQRTSEMSAGIMRDTARTGGWEGAEKTAAQFDRVAERAADALDRLDAALSTTPTGDPNYRRRGSDATEVLREDRDDR